MNYGNTLCDWHAKLILMDTAYSDDLLFHPRFVQMHDEELLRPRCVGGLHAGGRDVQLLHDVLGGRTGHPQPKVL